MPARSCPQCGAALAASDEPFARCDFCGAGLHLGAPVGIGHDVLLPILGEGQVAGRLARFLSQRDTIGRAKEVRARLTFLPFWVVTEAGASRLVPADTALRAAIRDSVALPAGDARPFDPAAPPPGDFAPPTLPLGAVVPDPAQPPEGTRLLHVPYFRVAYRLYTADHDALVSAVDGTVIPFSFPAAAGERWLDLLNAAVMAAVFLAVFHGAREIVLFDTWRAPGAWHLLVAGPVAWAVLWGASRLRLR